MKPFDLSAAQRGEPICTECTGDPCNFIGVDSKGWIVVEFPDGSLDSYTSYDLCMAPKKRTVWVNLYHAFYTEEDADAADTISNDHRIGGKAYPLEVEE